MRVSLTPCALKLSSDFFEPLCTLPYADSLILLSEAFLDTLF